MQLLVAIVQSEDADILLKRLNAADYRATRINTVGGFLAQGNVTILVGVQDDQVDDVIAHHPENLPDTAEFHQSHSTRH